MEMNTSDGTISRFGIGYPNCWRRCSVLNGVLFSRLPFLCLLVLPSLAVSTFTGCRPCLSAQCACVADNVTSFSSPIIGLTLVVTSDNRWPMVSSRLNFTATVHTGTPQRYEWMSSDKNQTAVSVQPYAYRWFSEPGNYSMTVNASNTVGYHIASVNFTVCQRAEATVAYSQVPRTAVVGQTFVLSVSVEANMYSLIECSLFLNDEKIGNASDLDAVVRHRGRHIVPISVHVCLEVSGKHRVNLLVTDIVDGEMQSFVWYIDAFDAIVDVLIDLPAPAIVTCSTTAFTARHVAGGQRITYLWDFGDQSTVVYTDRRRIVAIQYFKYSFITHVISNVMYPSIFWYCTKPHS